ncbi:MAG: sulfotransferase [Planctomycetota bacterium]|nr:sulfotransferase [Planctomycetota bacterium]
MVDSHAAALQNAERLLAGGDWAAAETTLRMAITRDLSNEDVAKAWCNVMLGYGDVREGRSLLEKITQAGLQHPLIPFCVALGYQTDGNFDEAKCMLNDIRASYPDWHRATHLLARILSLEGKHDEAIEMIDPLIASDDPLVICAFGLVAPSVGRTTEAINRLSALCDRRDLPLGIRNEAGLLMARLLDAEGKYDEALEVAIQTHALSPSQYRPDAIEKLIAGRVRDSPAERIAANVTADGDTERPIFILGMPRSGTSLTEAILGEHPEIAPLGECRVIERFVPLDLTNTAMVNHRSGQILAAYRDLDANRRLVTDKQLGNFLHLDAVASLLPQSRVIWCRRDRRDVAISCFFQQFQTGTPWTGDIAHTLHFEQLYFRLMRHWEQVLCLPMLHLDYEALVNDPRDQVARMLKFLGLPWEEQCLQFDESSRTTLTVSNAQVKKRLYRSSIDRWKRYPRLFD